MVRIEGLNRGENDKVRGGGNPEERRQPPWYYPKHQQRIAANAADFNIWIARNKPGNDGLEMRKKLPVNPYKIYQKSTA